MVTVPVSIPQHKQDTAKLYFTTHTLFPVSSPLYLDISIFVFVVSSSDCNAICGSVDMTIGWWRGDSEGDANMVIMGQHQQPPAASTSQHQPAPINYPFGCIWKHRDAALCWHSYDDIMRTLGIVVWLGDSDTLTMCNISPHQVKFQRSYVTNDVRSAISWRALH